MVNNLDRVLFSLMPYYSRSGIVIKKKPKRPNLKRGGKRKNSTPVKVMRTIRNRRSKNRGLVNTKSIF